MTEETKKVLEKLKNYEAKLEEADYNAVYRFASTIKSVVEQYFPLGDNNIIKDLDKVQKNIDKYQDKYFDYSFNLFRNALLSLIDVFESEILNEQSNKNNKENMIINNNITQTQEQHQTQELSLLECIKDGLGKPDERDKRLEELKKIAQAEPDREKAKPKIIEKLKDFEDFGGNVCSNIVANILTNPTIWASLF